MPLPSSSAVTAVLCQPVSPFDDVGRLLADHDGGRGRVARGDLGHDGCVGHPEPSDPVHPQLGVHHGQRVGGRTHPARPHVVVVLVRDVPGVRLTEVLMKMKMSHASNLSINEHVKEILCLCFAVRSLSTG